MTDLVLVFPYFNDDTSFFKFPPLGLGCLASTVREKGYSVDIVDCTFLEKEEAISRVRGLKPRALGVFSMLSMRDAALMFAREFREECELLIAGGPQPTVSPEKYADDFDIVGLGECENTILDLMHTFENGGDYSKVNGIAYNESSASSSGSLLQITKQVHRTEPRERIKDLESLPFPARDLFDHSPYQRYYREHYGPTMTHMMCSRGCPFSCNFCSKPVFGSFYRNRSAKSIVDEIEDIQTYGYERVWFSDDIFPINKKLVEDVSSEINQRGLDVEWGCLCRSDLMNEELARKMKRGGCFQVFFGLESGNNEVLKMMNKAITVEQSKVAVNSCVKVGIKVGGFFILGYPGENNKTMLETIKFASSLPLDYFSFTVPYPIPGTKLYESVLGRMVTDEWVKPKGEAVDQKLIWASDFSEKKLKFGIRKARLQGSMRKKLGPGYYLAGKPIEVVTDQIFRMMK